MNFKNDWLEFLKKDMPSYGLQHDVSKSAWENTCRYLNAKRRTPAKVPRRVRESRELCIPKQHHHDYEQLKKVMIEGGDLKPYLSRDIRKNNTDRNDGLLNTWGIQHLHLRPKGSRDVLFVKITDSDVFVIQCLPHGQGRREVWVNTALPEILHNNWPELDIGTLAGIQADSLTSSQMLSLREKHVNFAIALADGTTCGVSGGGIAASGRCILDVRDADRIFSSLENYQKVVEVNEMSIREALELSPCEELSLKLIFDNERECWLLEPNKRARISLHFCEPTG